MSITPNSVQVCVCVCTCARMCDGRKGRAQRDGAQLHVEWRPLLLQHIGAPIEMKQKKTCVRAALSPRSLPPLIIHMAVLSLSHTHTHARARTHTHTVACANKLFSQRKHILWFLCVFCSVSLLNYFWPPTQLKAVPCRIVFVIHGLLENFSNPGLCFKHHALLLFYNQLIKHQSRNAQIRGQETVTRIYS